MNYSQQKVAQVVIRGYRTFLIEALVIYTLGLLTGAVFDLMASVIDLIDRITL